MSSEQPDIHISEIGIHGTDMQSSIFQRNTIRGAQKETGIPEIGKNSRL